MKTLEGFVVARGQLRGHSINLRAYENENSDPLFPLFLEYKFCPNI